MFFEDGPGVVALEADSGRDELGGVDHRTAPHGQQEVKPAFADLRHCLHRGLVARVGLDTAEGGVLALAQRGAPLGPRTGLFGAGATHEDQHLGGSGHELGQVGNAALAEGDVGGVVEVEIQHGGLSGRGRRMRRWGSHCAAHPRPGGVAWAIALPPPRSSPALQRKPATWCTVSASRWGCEKYAEWLASMDDTVAQGEAAIILRCSSMVTARACVRSVLRRGTMP